MHLQWDVFAIVATLKVALGLYLAQESSRFYPQQECHNGPTAPQSRQEYTAVAHPFLKPTAPYSTGSAHPHPYQDQASSVLHQSQSEVAWGVGSIPNPHLPPHSFR